jgi:nitrite reductase/ring-hydroxylating ferredoxin subunit
MLRTGTGARTAMDVEVAMTEQTASSPWWAVARSEEVSDAKPLSVDIGEQPLVLWRDRGGIARALEDRCPHRRAPLSRGCIRDNGSIQCGYHGWSYDGATGRLTEIPNMKDKQKFPPLYRATAFAVQEGGGFVRVCLNGNAAAADVAVTPAPASLAPVNSEALMPLSGSVHVGLAHEQYIATLYDDPSLLIAIRGLEFTPYLMSELREQNGWLTMERSCQWRYLHWPAPFSPEFPITILSFTHPLTGEMRLTVRDADFNEYLRVALAPVPAGRGVTSVRWRAELRKGLKGLRGLMLGRGNPLTVHATVDAAALRVLKPGVSLHGAQLRAQLLTNRAAIAA